MKTLRFQVDDKIARILEKRAKILGMKLNAYLQFILAQQALKDAKE